MTTAADIDIVGARPLDPARPVRVLLWDADGVLQHQLRRGEPDAAWTPRLDAWGGEGFAEAVFAAEVPALRGERPFREVLADVLDTWPGVTADVDDLLSLWEEVAVDSEAIDLVHEVAASGVECVLATNQQDHRKEFLRHHFDYDDVFAQSFYSCDMGAMKPEPAYFERVLDALGIRPEDAGDVGFVDDNEANVRTAAALGIRAVHHDPDGGVEGLRNVLGWSV
ncbi:HAD family hydrolase [Knoellia subterranea]|uniref:Hydrolase n=1 Tax=Knoellia subterranea KCTC 19937 TaxID=1385521 RepID=A0A0A0JH92_9MICO|nr:HAD-IA family hydrolase [Knoellia subterranea]KGN36104.1 hydrolase [Knoellia subterranea KCTC 19937]